MNESLPQETTNSAPISGEARKILIVEDDQDVCFMLQILMQREGYGVSTASDGVEGLKQLLAEKPDLILLDVMMAKLDGFKVLELIRRNPPTRHVPIVMLSALGDPETVARGMREGANAYVSKPFEPDHLLEIVRQTLDSSQK